MSMSIDVIFLFLKTSYSFVWTSFWGCLIHFWWRSIPDQSSFVCIVPLPKWCINVYTLWFCNCGSWQHKSKSNFGRILFTNLVDLDGENVSSISVWLVSFDCIAPDGKVLLIVVDKFVRATNRPAFYGHVEITKLVNRNED